ncbi:MAG: hypothetical protein AB2669_11880, partial [Candidatus Thiodiazotropha endolucinida]
MMRNHKEPNSVARVIRYITVNVIAIARCKGSRKNSFLITHKPQPFSGGDKASAEYAKQQRATVQS